MTGDDDPAPTEPPQQRCLRAYANTVMPYTIVSKTEPYRFTGVYKTILEIVTEHYGYCYTLYREPTASGFAGFQYPNGTWGPGLIRRLVQDEADVIATTTTIDYQRWKYIDFGEVLYVDQNGPAYMMPRLEPDLLNIVKPFTVTVWALLLAVLLMSMVVFWLIARASAKTHRTRSSLTATDSALVIVGTFLGQSFSQSVRQPNQYVFFFVWLLTMTIINMIYKSNLAAVFIKPNLKVPFESVEEMLQQNEVEYHVALGGMLDSSIAGAENGTLLGKLGERLGGRDSNAMAMFQAMAEGKYAMVVGNIPVMSAISMEYSKSASCPIYIGREGFFSIYNSMAFQKNSPYTKNFRTAFRGLFEFGIPNKLLRDATRNSTSCINRDALKVFESRPLAFGDFYGILAAFAAGMLAASLVFACEVLVFHLCKNRPMPCDEHGAPAFAAHRRAARTTGEMD